MEKEISFADSEHLGGQHKTFTENCSECFRENRILNAKRIVDRESLGTSIGQGRADDFTKFYNSNPHNE